MKTPNIFLILIVAGFWLYPTTGISAKPNPEECGFYDDHFVNIVEVYAATCKQSLSTSRNILGKGLFSREIDFTESEHGICYFYSVIGDGSWIYEGIMYIGTTIDGECESERTFVINDGLMSVRECEFAIKDLYSYLDSLPDCA